LKRESFLPGFRASFVLQNLFGILRAIVKDVEAELHIVLAFPEILAKEHAQISTVPNFFA
jgi:hypothetical protein